MIDLYPSDLRDRSIMAAVELLNRNGYHVIRPERFGHVFAEVSVQTREFARAPEYWRKNREEIAARMIAEKLTEMHLIELRDVSTQDDRLKTLEVRLRAEMIAVMPMVIQHPYTGEPLLNAVGRVVE